MVVAAAPKRRRTTSSAGGGGGDSSSSSSDEADDDGLPLLRFQRPNRIFYTGEIDQPHASRFNMLVFSTARRLRESRTSSPLEIYINSQGGSFHGGLSMHEHILMARRIHPVHVIADGFVASAATFVLIAGTRRLMTRTSFLLIHQISCDWFGSMKAADAKEESRNMSKEMRRMRQMYLQNTDVDAAYLDRLLTCERMLSFDVALRRGIVQGDNFDSTGDGGGEERTTTTTTKKRTTRRDKPRRREEKRQKAHTRVLVESLTRTRQPGCTSRATPTA